MEREPCAPMTLASLGGLLAGADESTRWRLVAEFLEEYGWEPAVTRGVLLTPEPGATGDEHRDVFLGGVAEVIGLCAEIFPEEPVPDRARLVLEDVFES